MSALLAGVCATAALALLVPLRRRLDPAPAPASAREGSMLRRWRLPCALLAGLAAPTLLGGVAGWVLAAPVAALVWWLAGRIEDPALARERARAARDLPHLVLLTANALSAGAAATRALSLAADALPGPAADRVRPVLARLEVGAPPASVWRALAADSVLGPLGRTLARSAETGAPVADAVHALAADLAEGARAEVEDRARAVGVRAALPLGLCLLPAFLLLGIVPVVAGLLATLTP